jgi:hypothetical protein
MDSHLIYLPLPLEILMGFRLLDLGMGQGEALEGEEAISKM